MEDQFYAALALLCLAAVAFLRGRASRALPGLVFALAASCYAYVLALRIDLLIHGWFTLPGSPALRYLLLHRFDLIALGVLLSFVARRHRRRIDVFYASW